MNSHKIVEEIHRHAIPLRHAQDLDVLVEAVGEAEYVLLGEASHGTSEFYTIRSELTKRLIQQKGFRFIAVEGDWPSCYAVNQYLKSNRASFPGDKMKAKPAISDDTRLDEAMRQFHRWPTWMWANQEIVTLIKWLKSHNSSIAKEHRIGFYGLDVYSLWESMEEIIGHLEKTNSPQLHAVKEAFACFEPFGQDEQSYGISAGIFGEGCEDDLIKALADLRSSKIQSSPAMGTEHEAGSGMNFGDEVESEASLNLEMNKLVTLNCETYYRTMVHGGPESWNVRDRHMVQALDKISEYHGAGTKAIIWEHNTHIGDARATDMSEDHMINVGQLLREKLGEDKIFAVGFGTYKGSVIAAKEWGAPLKEMNVPPARRNSWEALVHEAGSYDQILLFRGNDKWVELQQQLGHRAIGVVYDPLREAGNYVPSVLPERYDAFIHIDVTEALKPLSVEVSAPLH